MDKYFKFSTILLALPLVFTQQPVEKIVSFPLGCTVRQWNFTAKVSDENGKKCRARISTKACYGSCESFEYGTHEFPFIISVSPTCSYDNVKEVSMTMTDCDSGVSDSIKPFKYYEALSCICKELQPTHERHEAIPTKRDRLYEMYDESYDKEERDDELQRKADQYYEELLIS